MSSPKLPDFDALWDYDHPDQTEAKFREILLQFPENTRSFLELLTQIARAQGLQRKFEHAHQTLHQVERRLGEVPSRPRIRYLLERGRVFNSSGKTEQAQPLFEQAFELGRTEESLSRQMALKNEFESAGESDGYVLEEIGECLLALNRPQEARPYFLKAYELLLKDVWLLEKEPERLLRLKELSG